MDSLAVDHRHSDKAVTKRRGRDPEKVRANNRAYRERLRSAGLRPNQHSSDWKKRNRAHVAAYKRKRRALQGANPRGSRNLATDRDPYAALIVSNARQAWTYWIRVKAPDWWVDAYYLESGKPWNNPRLSKADKFKTRYWNDESFRAREILKIQRLKKNRAMHIDARNDGTLTPESLRSLFAEAKNCPYCKAPMRSQDKSLDHIVPLTRGGWHSLTNACVCCKTCNTSKGNRTLDEWIASMIERNAMN
jgi:hypothetical protein